MLVINPESCSLYRQGPGMPGPRPGPRAPVFPYTYGPHMRGAGEGAAGRKVPGAVKAAPYMAPVNGES